MDWSVTLIDATGARITGAAADTTLKIRRVADNFIYDWNDATFKNAAWVSPTIVLLEASAANLPGLYYRTVSEAAWSDGDYQGIVRYAPAGGTATNVDMLGSVRDGKEILVRIGDVVEAIDVAAALAAYDAATGTDVTTSEGVITAAIGALNDLSSADAQAAAAAALAAYDAATGTDVSTSEGVITAAIAALNDLSSADAQAAAAAALAAYDAATGTDVTTSEGVITAAIAALNDLSSADAQAAAAAALAAYDAATGTDVSTSEGVITAAIGALNDLSSADAQAAAAAALTAYGAATTADVAGVPAATDVVLSGAHGGGAWDGTAPPQVIRDAMLLAPTPGPPAAGSIDDQLGDLATAVGAVPAAVDVTLSAAHGAGAWGVGASLTPQQVRDAMKLAPSAGAPALGSVDTHLDNIDAKTTNLPSDPADQSAVEAAITVAVAPLATAVALATVDGVVDAILVDTGAMDARLPTDPADQSAVEAAITAAVAPLATGAGLTAAVAPLAKEATLVTTDGKVTAIKAKTDQLTFSGSNVQARVADKGVLNDLSSAGAQAAAAAALVAYDAATGADVTGAVAPLATTVQVAAVQAAIAALHDLSSADVEEVLVALGYTALRAAALDHLDADVSDTQTAAQATLDRAAIQADIAAVSGVVTATAASVEIVRRVETGRWQIIGDNMIFFDDDGTTPILTFRLYDDAGLPSMDRVFERVPV
jgi:hypothetical protein